MKFSIGDIDLVHEHTWCAVYGNTTFSFYAATMHGRSMRYYHQFIFPDLGDDKQVDHFNPDETLDNSRGNLRPATRSTQVINTNLRSNNTSGVKGVSFHAYSNSWRVKWRKDDDRDGVKYFSVLKYGSDSMAKTKAIAYRKKKEASTNKYIIASHPPDESVS